MSSFDSSTTFPCQPFTAALAPLDARHPEHYLRRLLLFPAAEASLPAHISALRAGAEVLSRRCPLLGGVLASLPPPQPASLSDWRTIVPGPGLEFVVRDLRASLPPYARLRAAHFPPTSLPYAALVPVPEAVPASDAPAAKIQVSVLEGGLVLAFAASHSTADGVGNDELLRVFAEASHGGGSGGGGEVGLDRRLLREIEGAPFDAAAHPAYRFDEDAPAGGAAPLPSFAAAGDEAVVLLRIPAASLARLKADVSGAGQISTHDALAALVWRSTMRVRRARSPLGPADLARETTSLFLPSDARRHLGLPQAYVGNAVYQLTATLPLAELLGAEGLRSGAAALRAAIGAVGPEGVASYMAQLRERWVGWRFLDAYATTGVAMGTDWGSSGLLELVWGGGLGRAEAYRYPDQAGVNCILPKTADGGAEVLVSVLPGEVDMLKGPEGFGPYLG